MLFLLFLLYSVTVVSGFAVVEPSWLSKAAGDTSAGVLSSQFHSTDNVMLYPQQPSSKLALAAKEYSYSLRQQNTLTSSAILLSSTGTRTGTSSFPTNAVSGDGSTASSDTTSYPNVQETLVATVTRGFVGENALRDIIASFSLLISTFGLLPTTYGVITGMGLMSEDQKWRKEVRKEDLKREDVIRKEEQKREDAILENQHTVRMEDVEWRKQVRKEDTEWRKQEQEHLEALRKEEQERQEALRKKEQEREDAIRKKEQEREDVIRKKEQEHLEALRKEERLFELKARQLDRVVDELRYKEGKSGDLLRDIIRMQGAEARDSLECKMLKEERNAVNKTMESLQKQKQKLEEELDLLLLGAK